MLPARWQTPWGIQGNSGCPGEHLWTFSDIFALFGPIFAYFEGNILSASAGGTFIEAGAFIQHCTVNIYLNLLEWYGYCGISVTILAFMIFLTVSGSYSYPHFPTCSNICHGFLGAVAAVTPDCRHGNEAPRFLNAAVAMAASQLIEGVPRLYLIPASSWQVN